MIGETPLEPTERGLDEAGDGRLAARARIRVLALYERGRGGAGVLREAAKLVEANAAELTVVTLAPQDRAPPACGVYADAYNAGVREDAAAELTEAARLLGPSGERGRYEQLVDGRDPPLEARAAAGGFDLVLLPGRSSLPAARHPARRALRRACDAEVRVIRG
jgi:hypothetical protein